MAVAALLWAAALPARAELFVIDSASDAILMYDEETGQFLGNFVDNAGIVEMARRLQFPRAAAFGPDGSLFVSGFDSFALLRYTAIGGNRGKFADASTSPAFGQPSGVAVRAGLLYVADATLNEVKRYDPSQDPNDAFLNVFASGSGVDNPEGIAFGPDSHLYVANANGSIARFNGSSGVLIGLLADGASGLQQPRDLTFGADDRLYVADPALSGKILRYNIGSGAFQDFFVNNDGNLSSPRTLAFGPDGKLYVGDVGDGSVRRYTAAGAPDGVFVASGAGGLIAPADLFFARPAGGTKLILSFHWWGLLALTCLFGALHLHGRRKPARLRSHGRPAAI
jgi:hypothetical protein